MKDNIKIEKFVPADPNLCDHDDRKSITWPGCEVVLSCTKCLRRIFLKYATEEEIENL